MEPFSVFVCVVCGVVVLGIAGMAWMMARRPEWLEQYQHCQEAATQKCKNALGKAKAQAQSWFGRD